MGDHNRMPTDDALVAMVNAGSLPTDIARQCGVRHQTVYNALNRIEAAKPGTVHRKRKIRKPIDPLVVAAVAKDRGIDPASAIRAIQRKMKGQATGPIPARIWKRMPPDDVILRDRASGLTTRAMAERYGVSQPLVCQYLKRLSVGGLAAVSQAPARPPRVAVAAHSFDAVRERALLVAELVKGGVTVEQAVDIVKRVA